MSSSSSSTSSRVLRSSQSTSAPATAAPAPAPAAPGGRGSGSRGGRSRGGRGRGGRGGAAATPTSPQVQATASAAAATSSPPPESDISPNLGTAAVVDPATPVGHLPCVATLGLQGSEPKVHPARVYFADGTPFGDLEQVDVSFRCYDLVTKVQPVGGGLPDFRQASLDAEKVGHSSVDSSPAFRRLLAGSVLADCVVRLALSAGLLKESAGCVFLPTPAEISTRAENRERAASPMLSPPCTPAPGCALPSSTSAGVQSSASSSTMQQQGGSSSAAEEGLEEVDPEEQPFVRFFTTQHSRFEPPTRRQRVLGPAEARDLARFALCKECHTENVAQFIFCWQCGQPPSSAAPARRVPHRSPMFIDHTLLQARRRQVVSAMEGRPGQVRKSKAADDFDAFVLAWSGGRRGWATATPDDVFDWLCFLDTQGKGTTVVHALSCPGVGSVETSVCVAGSGCARRYAAESLRTSFYSKLRMAYREQLARADPWDPAARFGNPCDAPLVDSYLTCVAEEQKRGGVSVKQAEPLLAHILEQLLDSMRMRAQLSPRVADRISITRDIALFALAFYTMRRGFDLSCTLASQVLQLPQDKGYIFNFQFGKTLRASTESVVVLADADNYQTCAVRAVSAYIEAARGLGWDLGLGHLLPVILDGGERGLSPLSPPRMTAALQTHLRGAKLPTTFTMHSFRVGGSLSESLAGTAVDEIMKLGGWKTESIAAHYIRPTVSEAAAGQRRQFDSDYAEADKLPLCAEFRERFAACVPR